MEFVDLADVGLANTGSFTVVVGITISPMEAKRINIRDRLVWVCCLNFIIITKRN